MNQSHNCVEQHNLGNIMPESDWLQSGLSHLFLPKMDN